jgi:ABC-2 type transport system ATP-binding protein
MIEVRHLTRQFGKYMALDDVSFAAEKGKIYGFLGPNGAGKTTAMNIMTGCLAATSGEVLVDGENILKKPRRVKRKIGYLPEVPPLYPEMTVREFLRFTAELRGVPARDRKTAVEDLMAKAGIGAMADRLIRNLSKGYRQRTGLAMAMIGDPEILILDEPSSGLDPEQQRQMFLVIRELRENHTVILSSHILPEVSALCDEIWILDRGVLRASGTPAKLQEKIRGTLTYRLTSDGDAEKVAAVLEALPHVREVSPSNQNEDGGWTFTISTDTADDISAELSRAVFQAGYSVLRLGREETSLEDVFLKLTGDGKEKA